MGLRIATNVSAISAQHSMATSTRELSKSMAQLSSGSRITKSGDDAAGLAISENLKSQLRSYSQAGRNLSDGISFVQVAEGGLNETSNILTRMRELGIQASSDTISDKERVMVNNEVQQLKSEVDRISQTVKYGNQALLNGTGGKVEIQAGIQNDPSNDRISYDASKANATASNLGIDDFDYSTKEGAQSALGTLDKAQSSVNGFRATLGALQNRFEASLNNNGTMVENLSAANSRIRDADIAESSSNMTKNNILLAASNATLVQANMVPNMALKLIG